MYGRTIVSQEVELDREKALNRCSIYTSAVAVVLVLLCAELA
jgi:hypothetical protein